MMKKQIAKLIKRYAQIPTSFQESEELRSQVEEGRVPPKPVDPQLSLPGIPAPYRRPQTIPEQQQELHEDAIRRREEEKERNLFWRGYNKYENPAEEGEQGSFGDYLYYKNPYGASPLTEWMYSNKAKEIKDLERKRRDTPKLTGEYRWPSSGNFPPLSDAELNTIFNTREWIDQKIEEEAKKERQRLIDIRLRQRDRFFEQGQLTKEEYDEYEIGLTDAEKDSIYEQVLMDWGDIKYKSRPLRIVKSIYGEFREVYASMLEIIQEASETMRDVPNPFIYQKNMEQKSLLEVWGEVGDLIEAGILYGLANKILNWKFPSALLKPQKRYDVEPFEQALMDMKYYEEAWLAKDELLARVKTDFTKRIDEWMQQPNSREILQFLDENYPFVKYTLFKKIAVTLGMVYSQLYDGAKVIDILGSLTTDLEQVGERLYFKAREEIEGTVQSGVPALEDLKKKYTDILTVECKKITDPIKNITSDIDLVGKFRWGESVRHSVDYYRTGKWQEINRAGNEEEIKEHTKPPEDHLDWGQIEDRYNSLKEYLVPYFDLGKFEKMTQMGMTREKRANQVPASDVEMLTFKAMVVGSFNKISPDTLVSFSDELIRSLIAANREDKNLDKLRDELAQKAKETVQEACVKRAFGGKHSTASWISQVLSSMSFAALQKMSTDADSGMVMGARELIAKLVDKYSEYDPKMMKKFFNIILKEQGYDALSRLTKDRIEELFAMGMMKKFGKTDAQQLYDIYSTINASVTHYGDFIKQYTPNSISSNKEIANFLVRCIRGINTWQKDLQIVLSMVKLSHNYAYDIDEDVLVGLIQSSNASSIVTQNTLESGRVMFSDGPDIIKKFYTLVLKIVGQGGYQEVSKKYAEEIKDLTERGALDPGFEERVQDLADIFRQGIKINPSKNNFKEIKALIAQLTSDLDLVLEYSVFKKYYREAEKYEKNENLFKLDMNITKSIRFRVLKDLDIKHFKVGDETDCCQSPGGAGENAMVDSFINPWAGVLVLEHDRPEEGWTTVAQSYFHYVPPGVTKGEIGDFDVEEDEAAIIDSFAADDKDAERFQKGGYILDNIEVNSDYGDEVEEIPIAEIYAYWAMVKLKEIPEIGYIQSGAGYSDISTSMFGGIMMEEDPRNFAVSDPYTDWNENKLNMDLSKPDFTFQKLPDLRVDTEYEKLAALASEFWRMTV